MALNRCSDTVQPPVLDYLAAPPYGLWVRRKGAALR
jgi:hypothetical protein